MIEPAIFLLLVLAFMAMIACDWLPADCWLARALDSLTMSGSAEAQARDEAGEDAGPSPS